MLEICVGNILLKQFWKRKKSTPQDWTAGFYCVCKKQGQPKVISPRFAKFLHWNPEMDVTAIIYEIRKIIRSKWWWLHVLRLAPKVLCSSLLSKLPRTPCLNVTEVKVLSCVIKLSLSFMVIHLVLYTTPQHQKHILNLREASRTTKQIYWTIRNNRVNKRLSFVYSC